MYASLNFQHLLKAQEPDSQVYSHLFCEQCGYIVLYFYISVNMSILLGQLASSEEAPFTHLWYRKLPPGKLPSGRTEKVPSTEQDNLLPGCLKRS